MSPPNPFKPEDFNPGLAKIEDLFDSVWSATTIVFERLTTRDRLVLLKKMGFDETEILKYFPISDLTEDEEIARVMNTALTHDGEADKVFANQKNFINSSYNAEKLIKYTLPKIDPLEDEMTERLITLAERVVTFEEDHNTTLDHHKLMLAMSRYLSIEATKNENELPKKGDGRGA